MVAAAAAGVVLAAGSFVYPEALLIVLGLGVYEGAELLRAAKRLAVSRRQARLPALVATCRPYLWRMAILAVTPIVYALWWGYLRVHVGSWP